MITGDLLNIRIGKNAVLLFLFMCAATCRSGAQNETIRTLHDFTSISEQYLQKAQEFYNTGDYDSCIAVLNKGIQVSIFDRKGKEDMLCLKIKAYLEKDDLISAELVMKEMLKHNPNYELNESQHTEDFNRLFKQFDIHAQITFGVRNALLSPSLVTTAVYMVNPSYNYKDPYTMASYFLMYYGWAEYQFRDNISVNMEGVFWNLAYGRTVNYTRYDQFKINEVMQVMEIPVFARFYMPHKLNLPFLKNILPYAALGMGYIHIRNATANVSEIFTDPATNTVNRVAVENSINMAPMRTTNTFEVVYGLGIGYKLKNLRLYLDWRSYNGFSSLTDASKRSSNYDLNHTYNYVDNGIKLNKSELGASISYTLKNSVKKRKIAPEHKSRAELHINKPH